MIFKRISLDFVCTQLHYPTFFYHLFIVTRFKTKMKFVFMFYNFVKKRKINMCAWHPLRFDDGGNMPTFSF